MTILTAFLPCSHAFDNNIRGTLPVQWSNMTKVEKM